MKVIFMQVNLRVRIVPRHLSCKQVKVKLLTSTSVITRIVGKLLSISVLHVIDCALSYSTEMNLTPNTTLRKPNDQLKVKLLNPKKK